MSPSPQRLMMVILLWFAMPLSTALASEITVAYHDPLLEPLSLRLSSELGSQGYQVFLERLPLEPGCESYIDRQTPADVKFNHVRVHLGRVPGSQDAACAAISYSTQSDVGQAHVTSSLNDVERFSIQVAEALNGLRARSLANPRESDANAATRDTVREVGRQRSPVSLGTSGTVLLDLRNPSPLLGVGVLVELPLASDWELQFDTAWTVTSLSFEERDTQLEARLVWARLGVAFRVLPHPTELDLVAGAGATVTWVTARVAPPDIARADVATSALFSAGSLFAYPSDAPLHAYVALRASTLVPAIRFELPSGATAPFGNLLGEGAVGVRASW